MVQFLLYGFYLSKKFSRIMNEMKLILVIVSSFWATPTFPNARFSVCRMQRGVREWPLL